MSRFCLPFLILIALTGCDARSNLDGFDYPPSTAYDSADWPALAPTNSLIAGKPSVSEAETADLSSLEARAAALKTRAATLGVPGFDLSRVARLKRRAAALRAAEI